MMNKFYINVYETKNSIFEIGYEDGKKFITENKFKPSLYIESNKESLTHKTLYEKKVEEIKFDTFGKYRSYKKSYSDVFELYNDIEPKYQYINKNYKDDVVFDFSLIRIFHFDIEVNSTDGFPHPYLAEHPIVSCSFKDTKTQKIIQFGLLDYDKSKTINTEEDITYIQCETEEILLKNMIKLIKTSRPDIIDGYNADGFDYPYFLHRIIKILGEEAGTEMSPIQQPMIFRMNEMDNGKYKYHCEIPGITLLDMMLLIKKYMPGGRESFALDAVSEEILGTKKLDYSEYDSLVDLYNKNYQKFIDYNIIDSILLDKLEKKLGLIELHCTIAYFAKANIEDVISPVKTWDIILFNKFSKDNIVIPPHKKKDSKSYAGAFVLDPKPGVYGWAISMDLNSLYPMTICQYNISPETLIDKKEDVNQESIDERFFTKEIKPSVKNACLAGNGYYFDTNKKGLIPKIIDEIYNTRSLVKKEMLKEKQLLEDNPTKELEMSIAKKHNIQLALKTEMNSFYGALASKYFRYFDIRLASAITLSGQLAIKTAQRKINKEMKKDVVVAMDTDSCYILVEHLIDKIKKQKPNITTDAIVNYCDMFGKKYLEKWVKDGYADLVDYLKCRENYMVMKREKISEKIMLLGKKKYAFLVWDDEGVRFKEKKLKVTGIEIVRSSTPKAIKPYLKESLMIIFDNDKDKLIEYIEETKSAFMKMNPEEIAFPRSVSNISKWIDNLGNMKSGIPIGSRAAYVFNKYIDKMNLSDFKLEDGCKIKFLYMQQPNKCFNQNIFGFASKMPTELVIYIDKELQFEKCYKSIIRTISERIGLDIDQKEKSLTDSFF